MNNKRFLSWLMTASIVLSFTPTVALAADFPGEGSGTSNDPYLITTAEELDAVRDNLSAYYRLENDINLSETDYASDWTPIGTYMPDADDPSGETPDDEYAFCGTFDGNGCTISGLTITDETMCVGLFGVIASATVKDLTIENATISGNTMAAAAVGYAFDSEIDNVDLSGTNTITGIVDDSGDQPAPPNMLAGIVGAGMDSSISKCDVTGTTMGMAVVDGANMLGMNVHDIGLVSGGLEGCNLDECTAGNSSITADGDYCFGIGGLTGCGMSSETITDCQVTDVNITAGDYAYLVGGLTGYTGQDGEKIATQVSGCSADAEITLGDTSSRVGGLIGGGFYLEMYKAYFPIPARFDVTDCHTDGSITAGADSEAIGTIVGYACLCNVDGDSAISGDEIGIDQSPFAGGDGTEGTPYEIADAAQLYSMRYDLDANYVLTADIDLDELKMDMGGSTYNGWRPIGILTYSNDVDMNTGDMDMDKAFSGTLDGGNHTISNVNVTTDGDMLAVGGVISCSTGTVKNLSVEDVTVTGDETAMTSGGVVGYAMAGTVSGITLKGTNTVTGINCTGGIVGGSQAAISNCTVEGTTEIVVIGDNDFSNGRIIQCDVAECGGLIVGGGFSGSVKDCNATGTITADGNEPVGIGGIGGCLQCMEEISGNTADVTINMSNGGHAIGGLCGFAGMGDDGKGTVAAPSEISNCAVTVDINAPGATHIGGLVGTGLYYYGMEDRFNITNCSVAGTIIAGTDASSAYGVSTPGAVAGRAVGSDVEGCTFDGLTINGVAAADKVGITGLMYESGDQYDDDASGALLYGLTDTYQQLFEGATFNTEYNHYWNDYTAAVVGADKADATVAQLKNHINGTLYGQAAVDAYTANPENTQFFCGFTGDLATITFNGSQISGYDADGTVIFSHPYQYVGEDHLYMGTEERMDAWVFQSLDDNEDEYKYFFMCGDTPDTTYHIEFRYGSERGDNLNQFASGDCAYWLAAGIPTRALEDTDETLLEQVIALFCLENMDYTAARTTSSLSQISDLIGTWDYYLNGQAQSGTLYFTVDANGNGKTYYNGKKASEYQVFSYDNDGSDSTKSGIYVAYVPDSDEEALKWSNYDITSSNGKTFFTLRGEEDGQAYEVTYVKHTKKSSGGSGSSSGSTGNTTATTTPTTTNSSSEFSATVSGSTATVSATEAQLKEIASGKDEVKIDVSKLKVDEVVIPAKLISAAEDTDLEVALPAGTVTLDEKVLAAVKDKGDIKLSIETVSSSQLSDAQKAVLGKQTETALVVDVNLYAGGTKTSTFGNGEISVSVPYTLKSGESADSITVWFVKDDGTIERKEGKYNASKGCVEFTTDHLSQYLILSFPFTDVDEDSWYYGSVAYAYNNSLFAGTGATTFGPNVAMTRQMIWMVLARMDGKAPADMEAARTWAIENGISDGSNPTASINREQMASILYRYAQYKGYDLSAGNGTNLSSFKDASSVSKYAVTAMQWTCGAGLIAGSDSNVMPAGGATRAQVAAILQRFESLKK